MQGSTAYFAGTFFGFGIATGLLLLFPFPGDITNYGIYLGIIISGASNFFGYLMYKIFNKFPTEDIIDEL